MRTIAKRLVSLTATLAMALGLVTVLSGTAQAVPEPRIKAVIEWNVSEITTGGFVHERAYYHVIDRIHAESYGGDTHIDGVRQTQDNSVELIQIRVTDTNGDYLSSIYLWAHDLYVAGFYSPGRNGHSGMHWSFNDRTDEFARALRIPRNTLHVMNPTGNYSTLPGGNDRGELVLNPGRIYNAMYQLGDVTRYTDEVGHNLLIAIQIFSEAARFAGVFDTVRGNIANPHRDWAIDHWEPAPRGFVRYSLVENQWGAISDFVRNVRNSPNHSIEIMGHHVTSIVALLYWLGGFVELNGSRARL
ncbi:ribosome-inactivating family protein [Kitasatospora sp. NPDC048286]|uniref:ribosome-inactivating family protein n=1 Tax=unclassified Kitasatospora TaxID=2633591 RepID=UPI003722C1C9